MARQPRTGDQHEYSGEYFLLLVTLAAVASTPALGQAVPAPLRQRAALSKAARPSRISPALEPPISPGFRAAAVRTRPGCEQVARARGTASRRRQHLAASRRLQQSDLETRSGRSREESGEISLAGVAFPSPWNQCWPQGVPYIFSNMGIQMLQQADKITILYHHNGEFRQVPLNQSHPAQVRRPGMGTRSPITKATRW